MFLLYIIIILIIIDCFSKKQISPASGIVSCAVNFLPAVVPPLLRFLGDDESSDGSGPPSSSSSIWVLAIMAVLAAGCAVLATLWHENELGETDHMPDDSTHPVDKNNGDEIESEGIKYARITTDTDF